MHDNATSSQNHTNLQTTFPKVVELIFSEIRAFGPMTFERFMDLALYCPDCGFYDKESDTVGKEGHFYTSVSVGDLFGRLLAFQFADWISALNPLVTPLTLVEAGAHDGRLAADILTWFMRHRPDVFNHIQLCIVEPSARLRGRQQRTLVAFREKVRWAGSLSELGAINGVIYSNELLDAMPVRRFGWDAAGRRWFEWGVGLDAGNLAWCRLDSTDDIQNAMNAVGIQLSLELEAVLPDGFAVEVSAAARRWWSEAARLLDSGKMVALDYGLEANEIVSPQRRDGTLRSYQAHRSFTDVLANPGEQDITAHVNFTAIRNAGEHTGLRTECFKTQSQFLTSIAARAWNAGGSFGEWTAGDSHQFKTLTHPEHLGRTFRALVQTR